LQAPSARARPFPANQASDHELWRHGPDGDLFVYYRLSGGLFGGLRCLSGKSRMLMLQVPEMYVIFDPGLEALKLAVAFNYHV